MNRSRVTGNLSSHGNIFVDIANDRVGIGSTIPGEKLSLPDNAKIALGDSADFQLYHHSSGGSLFNSAGYIHIRASSSEVFIDGTTIHLRNHAGSETFLKGIANGAVELRYDNVKKFETQSTGAKVTGQLNVAASGNNEGIKVTNSANNSSIMFIASGGTDTGGFRLNHNGPNSQITIDRTNGSGDFSSNLIFISSTGDLKLVNDNSKLQVGASSDLSIYHDGSHSYIDDTGTGNLKLRSNNFRVSNADESKVSATFQAAGAAELYHNNSKKFETTAYGIDVTGTTGTDGLAVSGVATATTFSGSGASLTNLNGSNIASGTVPVARIGTGTKSTSTFYRGDGTFATVTPPAITTINSASNNRVVTSDGGTTVTAESNLTWDATTLKVQAATPALEISGTNSNGGNSSLHFNANANHWVLEADNYTQQNVFSIKEGTTSSSTPRLSINASGQTIIDSSGTEGGTNTRLAVCATGSPGSNPSSITNNVVATFRATGATGHAASIGILAGNTGSSAVHFGDTDNDIIGRLLYNHTSSNTSDYFEFYLQGSRRFRIQGNGNLCIGNDSNFTAGAKVEIRDTIGSGGGTMLILNEIGSSGANEGGHIEWRSGSDKQSDQCRIGQIANGTGSGSSFFISTNAGDSGSSTTRLLIGSAGQFGIGGSTYGTAGQVLTSGGASSPPTWTTITGTTINNNANNRLITGSGTANTLEGESTLTYDGAGNFTVYNASGASGVFVQTPNNTDGGIYFNDGSANSGALTYLHTDDSMKFRVNNTNRMIIGSTGAVALSGNNSATPPLAYDDLTGSNQAGLLIGSSSMTDSGIMLRTSTTGRGRIYFGDNSGSDGNRKQGQIVYYNDGDYMTFATNQLERMRLTAGGTGTANVLINGTNATTHSNVDDLLIGSTSGTHGITIKSGTSSYGCLYFHDANDTNAPKGQIEYQHGTEQMSFYANQELMMRIDGDEDEGRLRFTPNVIFSGSRNSNIVNETVMFATSQSTNNGYHDNHTITFGQNNGNWSEGTSSHDSSFGMMWHYSSSASATRALRAGIAYDHKGTEQFKIWSSYGAIVFYQDLANSGSETAETCDTECARFDDNGDFIPGANNARNLGSSAKKWKNIHVMDMHFSNDGGDPNCVDGTTGDWTLQEGNDGIYMINNKNGKKYEMMLKEVQ